jgi:Recombinase
MKKLTNCPSWLNLSADRLSFVYIPERAEIVRKIFELSIAGLGSYTIAKQLTRQGVVPFGPLKQWDHTTIDNMLRSRAVVGEFQPKSFVGGNNKGIPIGDPIPNYYPRIVDENTFNAAQSARRRNLASGRGRKGNTLANLFDGLTSCFYCGDPVKFHRSSASKSLICSRALLLKSCVRAAWSYENFERSVLNFVCHPALADAIEPSKRELLALLARDVSVVSFDANFDNRMQLSFALKDAVTTLRVASAGSSGRIHSEARIVRDLRERRFEICLWDSKSFIGLPTL